MNMNRFFLMMCMSVAALCGYAQQRDVKISGTVEDAFLKTPLVEAKVSICRADSSVVVD